MKQNETKKDYTNDFYLLNENCNLDDFILDEGWDDDGEERACLESCHYDDDIDGWMEGAI